MKQLTFKKYKLELSLVLAKTGTFLLLLLIAGNAMAQSASYIKGKVINGETDSVIANASVFITNTSKGTVTNSIGQFELTNVPVGTYDLVVSCIGFETQVYTYKANQLPLQVRIEMKPKVDELQTVVVEPYEKDGWETWGKFFIENFIGTTQNAKTCTIKNYKALRFRHSKKRNQLVVTADDPLIIENKALGYSVQYQLEEFNYNFKEATLLYYGYTLFKELNKNCPKTWQLKNREKAYNGSIQHFMSSLYNNRLAEQGFEVKRLFKAPNLEKERVKKIFRASLTNASNKKDSSDYYDRILRQPDMLETYGKDLLIADSLVTINDSLTKRLFFTDYLYVVYKNEKEEPEYLEYTREKRSVFYQRSVVFEPNSKAVFMDAAGNYFMPQDFMSYGYWGWNEKISNILPLDYK